MVHPLVNNKLVDASMSNNTTRCFIDSLDEIVHIILDKPEESNRVEQWLDVLSSYRELMELARKREDYSDEDIEAFQKLCDAFFSKWIDLHGTSGMTNYLHMLSAGHVTYYLHRYRNLYRYSNQGWESFNQKVKHLFFFHTQRGGYVKVSAGVDKRQRNYIKPIARFFLRDLMWKTGLAYNCFLQ